MPSHKSRSTIRLISVIALFLVVTGCATLASGPSPGRFYYAGPASVEADVLSVRWVYGFQFAVTQSDISHVKFSCEGLPGTNVTVKGDDLKMDQQGKALVYGEALPVSRNTTAWLYDAGSTDTICSVMVSRPGKQELVERAPVSFAALTKIALLQQLRSAHEYNRKLKKRAN